MKLTTLRLNWNQLLAIVAFASFSLALNPNSFAGGGTESSTQHSCGQTCVNGMCPKCKVACDVSKDEDTDEGKEEEVLCSKCGSVCTHGTCTKGHSCIAEPPAPTCSTDGGTCDSKGVCSKAGLPCGHAKEEPPKENTCSFHGTKFQGNICPCGSHVYTQTPTDICSFHNAYCCNGICSGISGGHPCNVKPPGSGGGGTRNPPAGAKKALVIRLKKSNE